MYVIIYDLSKDDLKQRIHRHIAALENNFFEIISIKLHIRFSKIISFEQLNFGSMFKLRMLKWEDYAELSIWSQNNYKNHYESKSEAKICQRRSQDNGKIQVNKHKKHFEELT